MIKLAILSGLVLSGYCMVLHQPQIPFTLGLQYQYDTPNYNFAYEVNDENTGDVKNQQESRRGDAVLGHYSLIQPDGIRRIVDYRADDHAGFLATVNNERPAPQQPAEEPQRSSPQPANPEPANLAAYWPAPTQNPTPAPAVAISRSSFVQTFSHSNPNPWI